MRAYNTQRWLLYGLLAPLCILNAAWWILQLCLSCEFESTLRRRSLGWRRLAKLTTQSARET